MKNLSHLRLAAALLAISSFGFTGCSKEDGIEPQQSASIRDLRADAGTINDRRRDDLPFQVRDSRTTDQGALDFTPAHHGDIDADDVVMFQIDKSALAGQAAYKLSISGKGLVQFIGSHDVQVPQAELRLSASHIHLLQSILDRRANQGPFGFDQEKAQQEERCYIIQRAGGRSIKSTMAASSRQFQDLEAEVLGALGLDKLIAGNTFGILHD